MDGMAKNTFEKIMKNIDLVDKAKKFRLREKLSVTVELDPSDCLHLQRAMKAELAYYNALAAHFSSRVKSFPEHILSIQDRWLDVYKIVAETSFDLNQLHSLTKPGSLLPKRLEPYRDILLPTNQFGKTAINERMVLLIAPVGINFWIEPQTKKAIAIEILNFYQEQANITSNPINASMQMEYTYRVAPETLESATFEQKRHIQLWRDSFKISYDETQETSYIKIPYIGKPIKIQNINLLEDNIWNHLLLHQETKGKTLKPNSPWVLELQHLKNSKYLIKYFESKRTNSGKIFHQAKAR
jgi:hypothetical protein